MKLLFCWIVPPFEGSPSGVPDWVGSVWTCSTCCLWITATSCGFTTSKKSSIRKDFCMDLLPKQGMTTSWGTIQGHLVKFVRNVLNMLSSTAQMSNLTTSVKDIYFSSKLPGLKSLKGCMQGLSKEQSLEQGTEEKLERIQYMGLTSMEAVLRRLYCFC